MKKERLLSGRIAKLILFVAGLVLLLFGNSPYLSPFHPFKVALDALVANLGALFIFVAILQWVFDEVAREDLIADIGESLGAIKFNQLGLIDAKVNSRDIDDSREWLSSELMIIGFLYDPNFVRNHADLIKKRLQQEKRTVLYHLSPNATEAIRYLDSSKSGLSEKRIQKIKDLKKMISTIFNDDARLIVIEHDRVLRYSFIYTEIAIWIRMVSNGAGHFQEIPAFKIAQGSPLFEFFKLDLKALGVLDG